MLPESSPSGDCGEESLPASLLASCGLLAIVGVAGRVENITLISTFMPTWQFPLFVRTSLIVDQGPTLL